jgi:hypothetical protein
VSKAPCAEFPADMRQSVGLPPLGVEEKVGQRQEATSEDEPKIRRISEVVVGECVKDEKDGPRRMEWARDDQRAGSIEDDGAERDNV